MSAVDSFGIELRLSADASGPKAVFVINGHELSALLPASDDGWTLIPASVLTDHADHLRGGPDRWEDPVEPWYPDSAVLACGCGQAGCDAVLARVDYGVDEVVWTLLSRDGIPLGISPFRFRRGQYDAAFRSIAT